MSQLVSPPENRQRLRYGGGGGEKSQEMGRKERRCRGDGSSAAWPALIWDRFASVHRALVGGAHGATRSLCNELVCVQLQAG